MCLSWNKQSTGGMEPTKGKRERSTSRPLSSLCSSAQGWGVTRLLHQNCQELPPTPPPSCNGPRASGRTSALPGGSQAGEGGPRGVAGTGRGWRAQPAMLYWPKAKNKTTPTPDASEGVQAPGRYIPHIPLLHHQLLLPWSPLPV